MKTICAGAAWSRSQRVASPRRCELALAPPLASCMRSRMRSLVVALGFSALLAACATTPAGDPSCFIGGCSSELCADQPEYSPCIWVEANQCYHDAICTRQQGTCGWLQTPELKLCLATHGGQ